MRNVDFIKKYGNREFIDMCKYIPIQLSVARAQKEIGGFKVYNGKKYVKFFNREKGNINLDFATIYDIGTDKIKRYLESIWGK